MKRGYSRLISVEQRKNTRNVILLVVLTIGVIALLMTSGIGLVGRISSFLSGLRGSKSITSNDTTPPAPPKFNLTSDFTNQQNYDLKGNAEPGSTVKLTFNGNDQTSLVDKNGNFLFSLNLTLGSNTFSATDQDPAGNLSQKTKDFTITYDNTPPNLNIDSPNDGAQFFGPGQRQVSIKGTTDPNTQITINDRVISVDDVGVFQYTLSLSTGDNMFDIKALDPAGNLTEKNLKLTYSE